MDKIGIENGQFNYPKQGSVPFYVNPGFQFPKMFYVEFSNAIGLWLAEIWAGVNLWVSGFSADADIGTGLALWLRLDTASMSVVA